MKLALARLSDRPHTRRPTPPLRRITNSLVLGDELFDAVVFLGAALEIPALLPGHDDWANEITAEFFPLRPEQQLGRLQAEARAARHPAAGAVRCLPTTDPDESDLIPVRRAA